MGLDFEFLCSRAGIALLQRLRGAKKASFERVRAEGWEQTFLSHHNPLGIGCGMALACCCWLLIVGSVRCWELGLPACCVVAVSAPLHPSLSCWLASGLLQCC